VYRLQEKAFGLVFRAYAGYYNGDPAHLPLDKDAPNPRLLTDGRCVAAIPILGGLHHQSFRGYVLTGDRSKIEDIAADHRGDGRYPTIRLRPRTDQSPGNPGSLGREAFVAMVQTTDLRNCDHLPSGGRMNWTRSRALLQQRQMRTGSMVVVSVRGEDTTQMAFVKDDEVVETLAPNRPGHSLDIRILPG